MSGRIWRVCVVGLDHMHAGDQIAVIQELDNAALAGVWDSSPHRLEQVSEDLSVAPALRFSDLERMLDEASPDIAVVCSTTREHRDHTEVLATRRVNVLLEKPFGSNLQDVQAMIAAAQRSNVQVGVNWPLAWYPSHRTAHRLIVDGTIGTVTEVHYYDGNRGPLFHSHGKKEIDAATARSAKDSSWWYDPAQGGGSLRDYLGYGATLATWFRAGELPTEVLAKTHNAHGDQVDEQSVTIGVYTTGLSTFQTRWGTFTDPWTLQPQPRCGFVIVGEHGTIASWDYDDHVTVQTTECPAQHPVSVDSIPDHESAGLRNMLHCLDARVPLYGPLSAEISLAGQRIVEAAAISALTGIAVRVEDVE